jgi:hypothetical protein
MGWLLTTSKELQMAISDLTAELIRDRLNYDELTGSMTWARRARGTPFGREAGCFDREGYRQIRLDGNSIKAHRIAWIHFYGAWPVGVIDHINGVKHDNRIVNLRDVDNTTNRQNVKKAYRRATPLPLGVSQEKGSKKFRACIFAHGKKYNLGQFENAEMASQVYLYAKRILHPGCTI